MIAVRGKVARRDEATINPNLPTGEIEVVAGELQILSESKTASIRSRGGAKRRRGDSTSAPLPGFETTDPIAEPCHAQPLALSARSYLDQQDFYEIETPF